jgi:RluA family pseudouridine synthase
MALPNDPIIIEVPAELDGTPAEQIALARSGLGPAQVATIVGRGGLWVDGARVRDGARPLPAGSRLALRTPPGGVYREAEIAASDLLHEDEWLLALNKRPGWYVGPTPWDCEGSVLAGIERYLAARDGTSPPLHLAHQLDRDTSGVLLIGKHPAASKPLHEAFAGRQAHKRYLALCVGEPPEQAEVETGLGRGAGGGFYVYPLEQVGSRADSGRPPIRAAQTSFRLLERLRGAALVEALPRTGRTHQIRLHLMHLGHPILGDARYGGPIEHAGLAVPHHMLHAAALSLPHPQGGTLTLEAAPPASWARLLEALRI